MKDNKLGIMPISKLIWNMSLPIIVSMLVQALYNIVDSVFVSQVSEQALTAVTLAVPAQNLLIALAISSASSFARITRAQVMTIRGQEYIESANAMGLPTWKIILRHIIPNCLSPIIVQVTLSIGSTIIAASSLSFLGVGIPSPMPEWGAMLSDARGEIRNCGWMCVFPGLAIMFTVLALNLLGDGLRDALDPKLKK